MVVERVPLMEGTEEGCQVSQLVQDQVGRLVDVYSESG